uniref:Putative secreted protein n=1 Tax=Ixodes ricinus TaxID=34613 RepID=A0A6B0UU94_IXORI
MKTSSMRVIAMLAVFFLSSNAPLMMLTSSFSSLLYSLVSLMYSMSFSRSYTWPISSPRTQSRILEIGQDRGKVSTMNTLVTKRVRAPIWRPWREQMACGMISPKMTMLMVAPRTAIRPDVRSSSRMVRVLLTSTLPSSREQSR